MDSLTAYDKDLARIVMVSFFLPMRVQVLVLISIFLFWVIRDCITGAKNRSRPYGWALLLGNLFLLYAVYLPFTDESNQARLIFNLDKRLSLLLFPLVIVLLQPQTRKTLSSQLVFFVYGCFISCLVGNLGYLLKYGWNPTGSTAHITYRVCFEEITGIHPTYMGIYLCFSVAILLLSPNHRQQLKGWKLGAVLFPLFSFMMALMPKAPALALVIVLIYYGWINWQQQKKQIMPILAVLVVSVSVACISIPFSSQRIEELSDLLKTTPNSNPMESSIQMRRLIWTINMEVLKENWLTGVGPGYLDNVLAARYDAHSRMLNVPLMVFNSHNEYVNQWLTFGIVGFLSFLALLLVHFVTAIRRRDQLYVIVMIILSVTFFTENVLARQHGVIFYALFTSLFFFNGLPSKRRQQPQPRKINVAPIQRPVKRIPVPV